MSELALLGSASSVAVGVSTPFIAVGGVPPYAYSVIPNDQNALGTISNSGVYTAPANRLGIDILQVRDNSGTRAQTQVKVGTPLQLLCDIIVRELALEEDRVYLWDQKLRAPTDSGLYVAVANPSSKPFGASNKMDASGNAVQSVNMQATVMLDIASRDSSARDRKEELILALTSDYAKQQQMLNSFGIAMLSTDFINLSLVDGAAIPYRFNISVNLQYAVKKVKGVPFFSNFNQPTIITDPDGGTQ